MGEGSNHWPVLISYYVANLLYRLLDIKHKYDPSLVIDFPQGVPPTVLNNYPCGSGRVIATTIITTTNNAMVMKLQRTIVIYHQQRLHGGISSTTYSATNAHEII